VEEAETDAEIDALANELLGDPAYSEGTRRPPKLTREQAIAIAKVLHREVDRGCDARAEAAAAQHLPIVCSRGCNGCCEEMVLVYLPEAQTIAEWLMEPAQREIRDAFLAAYPIWAKAVGDAPKRLATLQAKGDHDVFLQAHNAQWRKRILCAFNHGGDCIIYPVRPMNCRNAHAVETHVLCSGANPGKRAAPRLEFPPLDEYRIGASRLLRAAHHALGGEKKTPMAVCEAVHRLLQSAMAAERKAQRGREA
jgi:hypothetical protein